MSISRSIPPAPLAPSDGPVVDKSSLGGLYLQLELVEEKDELVEKQGIEDLTVLSNAEVEDLQGLEADKAVTLLEEQGELLLSVRGMIDDSRGLIRTKINTLSRPPLHILDMPDEILIKIFGYVRDWEPDSMGSFSYHPVPSIDVNSLRLTCRRFCNTSSHLLLHFLNLDLEASSLSHLEEVSHHPSIRIGVRAIRVCLSFYEGYLADDLYEFSSYSVERLREQVDVLERRGYCGNFDTPDFTEEVFIGGVERAKAMLKSWNDFLEASLDDPQRDENMVVLFRAYEEYGKRYEAQKRLLSDGNFVQVASAAIARMPNAQRLSFNDYMREYMLPNHPSGVGLLWPLVEDNIFKNLIVPLSWEQARAYGWEKPPVQILLQLPVSLHKAGACLTALDIYLPPLEGYSVLASSEEDLKDLNAAMQRLKDISFKSPHSNFWLFPREKDDVEGLQKFLSAILDTESVSFMALDFGSLWDKTYTTPISLGSLITLRQRKNLSSVFLWSVPMHLTELEHFTDRQAEVIELLSFSNIHLLSGTWAEGLEILRKMPSGLIMFDSPTGGECEVLSHDEYQEIFKGNYFSEDERSKAEKYINKSTDQNPLRGGGEDATSLG